MLFSLFSFRLHLDICERFKKIQTLEKKIQTEVLQQASLKKLFFFYVCGVCREQKSLQEKK